MNALFVHFNYPPFKEVIKNVITRLDVKQCWNIAHPVAKFLEDEVPDGVNLIDIDYWDTYYCLYEKVDWDKITPIDHDLKVKMSSVESESLYMMVRDLPMYHEHASMRSRKKINYDKNLLNDRINKYYIEDLTYHERLRIYHRHLRYWNHFFLTHKVDVVMFSYLPHLTFEYILYSLAKFHGIRCIYPHYTFSIGMKIFTTNFRSSNKKITDTFNTLKNQYCNTEIQQIPLQGSVLTEWERVTSSPDTQKRPWYNNLPPDKPSSFYGNSEKRKQLVVKDSLLKKILDPDYWHFRLKGLNKPNERAKKLFDQYESRCSEPDFNEKYILVTLQYSPEANDSPIGWSFYGQILMLQMLSALLPENFKIYVKEHISQKRRGRSYLFYHDILSISKVKLMSRYAKIFELQNNCVAVANIAGTAGWEGLFKGKPWLVFGSWHFDLIPGAFYIRSLDDCRNALEKIIEQNYKPDLKDLKIFMKTLENEGVNCWIEPVESKVSSLSIEQNINNLSDAFCSNYENSAKSPSQPSLLTE